MTTIDSTTIATADGITQTLDTEYTIDQRWYFVSAVEDANLDNRRSGGFYSLPEAKAALKRYTTSVRRQRTINQKAAA